jgi:hypothetical protein
MCRGCGTKVPVTRHPTTPTPVVPATSQTVRPTPTAANPVKQTPYDKVMGLKRINK